MKRKNAKTHTASRSERGIGADPGYGAAGSGVEEDQAPRFSRIGDRGEKPFKYSRAREGQFPAAKSLLPKVPHFAMSQLKKREEAKGAETRIAIRK